MIIGGCLFIGIGIGMWLGDVGPGALIGLGAGLILQYLVGDVGARGKKKNTSGDAKKND